MIKMQPTIFINFKLLTHTTKFDSYWKKPVNI